MSTGTVSVIGREYDLGVSFMPRSLQGGQHFPYFLIGAFNKLIITPSVCRLIHHCGSTRTSTQMIWTAGASVSGATTKVLWPLTTAWGGQANCRARTHAGNISGAG